jgi:hypothetical protein
LGRYCYGMVTKMVAKAVVQPTWPGLPELYGLRSQQVTTPEVRHRHLRPLRPALKQPLVPVI